MNDINKIKECTQNMKLLYVEDEISIRESTTTFLKKFFNNLTIANDGQDGLEKFKESLNFDIVMTDIHMPNLNGVQMIKLIKELRKDSIIIFISADDHIDSIEYNDNTYIIKKPVAIENFINVFEKINARS